MTEPNVEADGVPQEHASKNEKPWKAYPPETYRHAIAELVHFSSKTVNSNAALVGVRLSSDDALDAPYVSARTLMARGVSLSLDYGKGGAAVAGICKQVNAAVRGDTFAEAASPEERAAIEGAMSEALSSAFSVGVEHVDHRLRQILIPKDGAEGGYVSMTPITAGGVCELLFEKEHGLVSRHNAACEEAKKQSKKDAADEAKKQPEKDAADEVKKQPEKDDADEAKKPSEQEDEEAGGASRPAIRKLRQAQFGIGGSNPQNVGGLVRVMQRPLFVDAPRSADDLRAAFSFYYKGISLDFSCPGPLRQALSAYAAFRRNYGLDGSVPLLPGKTRMETHEKEKALMKSIASIVLQRASEARDTLLEYAAMLPQETNPETGTAALVCPRLKPAALRGLLDPALRDAAWPRAMAWLVIGGMERAPSAKGNRMLVLDVTATATIEGDLEEAFR